jgi:hypothetical protein
MSYSALLRKNPSASTGNPFPSNDSTSEVLSKPSPQACSADTVRVCLRGDQDRIRALGIRPDPLVVVTIRGWNRSFAAPQANRRVTRHCMTQVAWRMPDGDWLTGVAACPARSATSTVALREVLNAIVSRISTGWQSQVHRPATRLGTTSGFGSAK